MPPRRTPPRLAAAAAALAVSCAGAGAAARRPEPAAEVLVEVLPRDAALWVDGVSAGVGGRTVAVPDAGHVYVLRAAARGFAPAERAEEGAALAGARVGIALAPDALGAGAVDFDDAEALARAAVALLRRGDARAAADYAARAAALAPGAPAAQRLLGDASRAAGARGRAADAYRAYLRLAPDAPDRDEVERAIEEMRAEVSVKGR
jgi:tetratricopeptide (TPR) repeat protein